MYAAICVEGMRAADAVSTGSIDCIITFDGMSDVEELPATTERTHKNL